MASRLHVRSVTIADDLFGDTRTVPKLFKHKTVPLQNVQFSEKYIHRIFLLSYMITKQFPTFQIIISEKLSSFQVNMVV
jgi:ATP-dependent RNA circularization protein (DNA/RNA ligase family)